MKKRSLVSFGGIVCAGFLVVVLLFIAACAPPPASAATPKPVAKPEPIVLRYGYSSAPGSYAAQVTHIVWGKMIEEKTGGKVKIEHYPADTLFKAADSFTAVKGGIADICWVTQGIFPGQFPLSEVITLPFLGIRSAEIGSQILWELQEKFPEIQAEYPGVKLLALHICQPYFLATTKKPVHNLAEFQGLKIRALTGPPTGMIKALGASPILMPPAYVYEAAQKGVIDGATLDWAPIDSYRLYEVMGYWTDIKTTSASFMVIMNSNKWNSLPEDVKQVMNGLIGVFLSKFQAREWFDKAEAYTAHKMKQAGFKMGKVILDSGEEQKWRELGGKPIWDKWIADMKAKGKPGQQVFDEMMKLLAKYK